MARVTRVHPVELKAAAVSRILAGETIAAVAEELGLDPKLLYDWRQVVRRGGFAALRRRGWQPRPARGGARVAERAASCPAGQDAAAHALAAAHARIGELERKIGHQQMDLDFFRAALRHTEAVRQPNNGLGATPSTLSSKR